MARFLDIPFPGPHTQLVLYRRLSAAKPARIWLTIGPITRPEISCDCSVLPMSTVTFRHKRQAPTAIPHLRPIAKPLNDPCRDPKPASLRSLLSTLGRGLGYHRGAQRFLGGSEGTHEPAPRRRGTRHGRRVWDSRRASSGECGAEEHAAPTPAERGGDGREGEERGGRRKRERDGSPPQGGTPAAHAPDPVSQRHPRTQRRPKLS